MSERFGATAQNINTAESFVYSDPGDFVDQYNQNQLRPEPSLSLKDIAEILDAKDSPLEIVKHTTNSKERDGTLADLNDPVPNDFAPDSIFAHAKNATKDRNSRDYKNKAVLTVRLTRGDSKRAFARTVYKVNDDITKLGFSGGTLFKNVYRTMNRIEDSSTGRLKYEYYAEMPKDDPSTRSALQAGGKYIAPGHQMLAKITPDFVREINEFQAEQEIKEIREVANRYGLDVSPAVAKQILAAEQSDVPQPVVQAAPVVPAAAPTITMAAVAPEAQMNTPVEYDAPETAINHAVNTTEINLAHQTAESEDIDLYVPSPSPAPELETISNQIINESMTEEIEAVPDDPTQEVQPVKEFKPLEPSDFEPASLPVEEESTKDDNPKGLKAKIGQTAMGAMFLRHPLKGVAVTAAGAAVIVGSGFALSHDSTPENLKGETASQELYAGLAETPISLSITDASAMAQMRIPTEKGMVESPFVNSVAGRLTEELPDRGPENPVTPEEVPALWDAVIGDEKIGPDMMPIKEASIDIAINAENTEDLPVDIKGSKVVVDLSKIDLQATPNLGDASISVWVAQGVIGEVSEAEMNAYADKVKTSEFGDYAINLAEQQFVDQMNDDPAVTEAIKQEITARIQGEYGEDVKVEFTGELAELTPTESFEEDKDSLITGYQAINFGTVKVEEEGE